MGVTLGRRADGVGTGTRAEQPGVGVGIKKANHIKVSSDNLIDYNKIANVARISKPPGIER